MDLTSLEHIIVSNIKCHGCAKTITKHLEAGGAKHVSVDVSTGTVSYSEADRDWIATELTKLGYPEVGTDPNLITNAKSYLSCALGKLS